MSLRAPKGHKVVVSDLSGIELRVNHYLWDVRRTRELYAADPQADLYRTFAASMYLILESEVDKNQRQLAKVAQLGLGFGAGAVTFKRVAKLMGNIKLTENEATNVMNSWRNTYVEIVNGWKSCNEMVKAMLNGSTYSPDPRGLVNALGNEVFLPSGRRLVYPNMRSETATDQTGTYRLQIIYGDGRHTSKLYGGLMDENLVQAIARDVVAGAALAVRATTGFVPVLSCHDELVYVVPEADAASFLAELNTAMRTPPPWLPGIVLWSEGDVADTYGNAK
jgi:DNA polymerase